MRSAALALLSLASSAVAEPPPSPFGQQPEACQADLLLDVTLPPRVELPALLATLAPLGQPFIVLARPAQLEGWPAEIEALEALGGEAGLWLSWPREPSPGHSGSPTASWSRLRADRRELRRAAGHAPRAAGTSQLSPQLEGSLDVFGFTLLLPAPDGLEAAPRRVVDLQGLQGTGVVILPIQPLEQDEALGDEAGLAALLDRTAAALELGAAPVVRVSLPAPVAMRQAALLQRWQREVLEPCGAALLGREQAEEAVLAWLRTADRPTGLLGMLVAPAAEKPPSAVAPPPRSVDDDELELVADALACSPTAGATLPHRVGDDLTLTQAWLALSMALRGGDPPLPLHPFLPPQTSPRSVLAPSGASIPAGDLRQVVIQLAPKPGQQVPSFTRVGEHALTAAELLCAMAGAVQGQDPVLVTTTYSPEPYSPGLGWD